MPNVKRNKIGDGDSRFYENIRDKTNMLSDEQKTSILSEEEVQYYDKITNEEIDYWLAEFQYLEGIDIYSAAAVAVASLAQAVGEGTVKKDEVIMLNITGGGESLTKEHHKVVYAKPNLVIDPETDEKEIISKVENLFK